MQQGRTANRQRQESKRSALYVNGRFLGQPPNGVRRYALELVAHWDQMLQAGELDAGRVEIVLLTPHGNGKPYSFKKIRTQAIGRLRGNLWEQIDLPRFVGHHALFSPCNSAPWIKREGQVVTIHDASVFAVPQAYGLLYRLKHRVLYRRLAATRQKIITVSEFSKGELIRWCNFSPENIRVIHSGCEHILDEPADRGVLQRNGLGDRPFVLGVGGHSVHKNLAANSSVDRDAR